MAGKIKLQDALIKAYELSLFTTEVLRPVFGSRLTIFETPVNESKRLTESEKGTIEQVLRYGELNLDDDSHLTFYEITLQPKVRIQHSKVTIQQYVRKLVIAGQAAIINFVHPDNKSAWRLSLVASDSKVKGGKIEQVKTLAKRYSYLLGPSEMCRTAAERFSELEAATEINLDTLIHAFSVETLSKAFFDEYKLHYEDFCDYFSERNRASSIFGVNLLPRETTEEKDKKLKPIRDFTKKLLGRVVFLYFVQKKGWLGATSTAYKDGDLDFIFKLFKASGGNDDFYPVWLSTLFFDTLNSEERKEENFKMPDKTLLKIPFLNGGLFEKEKFDEKQIVIKPKLFHSDNHKDEPRTKNNSNARGFFDFLNAFNFTVHEDSPDDHTVAIDPEMLGHIFENLLEDNKDKGAYYTPKEIVHYMCQESLIEYLFTSLTTGKDNTAGPHDADSLKIKLSNFIKYDLVSDVINYDQAILTALRNVKICDPAIGSGAFPMGLLQEILHAIELLNTNSPDVTAKVWGLNGWQPQKVKMNIIQNSIYGVDIEKGAVDIARLRFWLSLVVDLDKPEPLPNLDYKIVVGNSLVSKLKIGDEEEILEIDWVENTAEGLFVSKAHEILQRKLKEVAEAQEKFFNTKGDKKTQQQKIKKLKIELLITQLEKEIKRIESATGKNKKLTEAQKNIATAEAKIEIGGLNNTMRKLEKLSEKQSAPLQFFDWKIDFPEIMNKDLAKKVGFDIVIGNPPYGAKMSDGEKLCCKGKFSTAQTVPGIQKASLDSYTLFIELGFNNLVKDGNLNYIVPISVTSSDSLEGIHKLLENNCDLVRISSYSVRPQPVFENAVVNTSILFFKKTGTKNTSLLLTKMYRKNKNFDLKYLIENLQFIDVKKQKLIGRYPKISLNIEREILNKIFSTKPAIRDLLREKGKRIYYRFAGGRYFKVITNYSTKSSAERAVYFDKKIANTIGAILSSNLYFWYYQIYSDNLNLKAYEIESFTIPMEEFDDKKIEQIETIYTEYLIDIQKNSNVRQTSRYANIDSFREYRIGKSKKLIDKIDDLIAPLYGLTKDELNFIKNYEIEYRLSDDSE